MFEIDKDPIGVQNSLVLRFFFTNKNRDRKQNHNENTEKFLGKVVFSYGK